MSAVKVAAAEPPSPPALRLGVVGMVHDHVAGFLDGSRQRKDIQIVGIAEPSEELFGRYAKQFELDDALRWKSIETMLVEAKPEAVVVFTNIFDHRTVVTTCARHGVHVMVEKPLAVNIQHARTIDEAARKGKIHVLVNYETTWYRSSQAAYDSVHKEGSLGEIRKLVVHAGHRGPKEIGCAAEFIEWLTDPELNGGGGALVDFGCYGANLITWMMEGQRPISVTAVTQQIKPELYPRVKDEGTIILVYPRAQGIVQASWNWALGRKDMQVYGTAGYVTTVRDGSLRLRTRKSREKELPAAPLKPPHDDPLSYLAAVARGEIEPAGPSSIKINLVVTEILDAALRSAATGRTIRLDPDGAGGR